MRPSLPLWARAKCQISIDSRHAPPRPREFCFHSYYPALHTKHNWVNNFYYIWIFPSRARRHCQFRHLTFGERSRCIFSSYTSARARPRFRRNVKHYSERREYRGLSDSQRSNNVSRKLIMRESERESERLKSGSFTICRPDWVSWGIVMTCHAPRHVSWIQGLEIVMRLRHCLDNLKLLASSSTAISITTLPELLFSSIIFIFMRGPDNLCQHWTV